MAKELSKESSEDPVEDESTRRSREQFEKAEQLLRLGQVGMRILVIEMRKKMRIIVIEMRKN